MVNLIPQGNFLDKIGIPMEDQPVTTDPLEIANALIKRRRFVKSVDDLLIAAARALREQAAEIARLRAAGGTSQEGRPA
jgi:hypothetical protein